VSVNSQQPPPTSIIEVEPNDTIRNATFVSVFTPPDHIVFDGTIDTVEDEDWYHFFTPQSEFVSLVINSDPDVPIEVLLYSNDIQNNQLNFLGHWIGDPGQLVALNIPVIVADDGFHMLIKTPVHVSTGYNVEIWTPGFVR